MFWLLSGRYDQSTSVMADSSPLTSRSGHKRRHLHLGLLVIALALAAAIVAVLFVPERYRLVAAVAVAGAALSAAAYAYGRARSRHLDHFHPRERLAAFGASTLGNPYGVTSAILLALSLLVIFLPGQFGDKSSGKSIKTPAPTVTKTPIKIIEVPYGIPTVIEGRTWLGYESVNPRGLDSLNRSQAPPKGYRWVLFNVRVSADTKKAEFYAASTSLKLLDDQDSLLLPDYGAGIINAPQSYVRKGLAPYWTPAYLLKNERKIKALQVELFPGTTTLLNFRPATRTEFCQQFEKARQVDIANKRRPQPLPKDCPALLRAAQASALDDAEGSNSEADGTKNTPEEESTDPDTKTSSAPDANQPTSKG